MTTANIDAFIVAGGLSPWLKSYAGTEHRCLAPLGDKRLIDYIIAALQGSGRIRRIVVAARPEAWRFRGTLPADVLLCKAAGDLPATAFAASEALGPDASEKLLGVCDDIPLLTSLAVRDFLQPAMPSPKASFIIPSSQGCLPECLSRCKAHLRQAA